MHALLFLESIGTTELLVILVVALVIFGPRKLPELGRSLGKSLSEFKRASDDFKRTWEREVTLERVEQQKQLDHAMAGAPQAPVAEPPGAPGVALPPEGAIVARGAAPEPAPVNVTAATAPPEAPAAPAAPARKSDWL